MYAARESLGSRRQSSFTTQRRSLRDHGTGEDVARARFSVQRRCRSSVRCPSTKRSFGSCSATSAGAIGGSRQRPVPRRRLAEVERGVYRGKKALSTAGEAEVPIALPATARQRSGRQEFVSLVRPATKTSR